MENEGDKNPVHFPFFNFGKINEGVIRYTHPKICVKYRQKVTFR